MKNLPEKKLLVILAVGERIIYFLKIIHNTVLLLFIYNKGEKDTTSNKEIELLLEGYL